jgi:hypothetical protein
MLSEILAQKINDCLADVVDADDRCDVLDAMHQILELLWDTPRLRQDLKLRRRVNEALDAIIEPGDEEAASTAFLLVLVSLRRR